METVVVEPVVGPVVVEPAVGETVVELVVVEPVVGPVVGETVVEPVVVEPAVGETVVEPVAVSLPAVHHQSLPIGLKISHKCFLGNNPYCPLIGLQHRTSMLLWYWRCNAPIVFEIKLFVLAGKIIVASFLPIASAGYCPTSILGVFTCHRYQSRSTFI